MNTIGKKYRYDDDGSEALIKKLKRNQKEYNEHEVSIEINGEVVADGLKNFNKDFKDRIARLMASNQTFHVVETTYIAGETKKEYAIFEASKRGNNGGGGLNGIDEEMPFNAFKNTTSGNFEDKLTINNLENRIKFLEQGHATEIRFKDQEIANIKEKYGELQNYTNKKDEVIKELKEVVADLQKKTNLAEIGKAVAPTLAGVFMQSEIGQSVISGLMQQVGGSGGVKGLPGEGGQEIDPQMEKDHETMQQLRDVFGANYQNMSTVIQLLAEKQGMISHTIAYLQQH